MSENSKYLKSQKSFEAEKSKRPNWGPFQIFQHPLLQNIKNLSWVEKKISRPLGGKKFRRKVSPGRKKLTVEPFGIFQHPSHNAEKC